MPRQHGRRAILSLDASAGWWCSATAIVKGGVVTGRACRRAIGATALVSACLLLCLAPARSATPSPVMPKPNTQYTVFDHRTVGNGWHIEMTVSSDPRFLSQLVLYSERCNE